ncbi:MAG: cytidylate kinase family protein [Myxococcota bacterium]
MAIITISRGSLSGGAELARLLGEKLDHKVISREVIVDAAKTYGVAEDKITDGLEHAPGLWARFTGHEENYMLAVQATLAWHVSEGNTIYHGLAGAFLLGGLPGVLRIRLIAPMSYRVGAAVAQLGVSREQAVEHIRKIDHEREKWVRSLYGEDWADPSHYDIVLNLGDMSMETAAGLVACVIESKEYAWTTQTERAVKDFALKNRVRAHLRFRSRFADIPINVQVKDGVVRLAGDASFDAASAEIVQYVRSIEGVTRVMHGQQMVDEVEHTGEDVLAREIMIPLARYPHIHDSATLREAIVAISSSAVRLEDGFLISPRYVLVFDAQNDFVGVISRRDLLRGLAPGYRQMKEALEAAPAVLPTMTDGFEQAFAWNSLFSPRALAHAKEPVKTIMAPPKAAVNVEDPVGVVVSTMLQHKVDLIPVRDNERVVGVVLMTDIFDNVAQYVIEQGNV